MNWIKRWFSQLTCRRHIWRLLAIEFDGECVSQCDRCGKLRRRHLGEKP